MYADYYNYKFEYMPSFKIMDLHLLHTVYS